MVAVLFLFCAGCSLAEDSIALPAFVTEDIYGSPANSGVFAQYDLTVINLWGTTCYPCIEEMPALAEWTREMPENVHLVGVVMDVRDADDPGAEAARMICKATGADYPNWVLSKDLQGLFGSVQFTPTTVFVNRRGELVGQPIIGANVAGYQRFVEEYLSENQ